MLWLALHFPRLPLNALANSCSSSAVVAAGRVVVADQASESAGVVPGLRLAGALGLVPGLQLHERQGEREAEALHGLACWAGGFTPQVSLVPPDTLLLEIGGCLRLFGGVEVIVARIQAGCDAQGFEVVLSGAPSPLAATWLARAGMPGICASPEVALVALAALPVAACQWPGEILKRLQGFGFHLLGDLLPLPRAALGQRIGAECTRQLALALGEMPDPRPWFVFPEHFEQRLELPSRVEEAEGLLFAAKRLLAALCGWLQARGSGLSSLSLTLIHEGQATSELVLNTASPTRDEVRLTRLLRERLGRWQLAGPVYGLCLRAKDVVALPGHSAQLFQGGEAAAEAGGALACLERIQARLGEDRVFVLGAQADYRPEFASRPLPPGQGVATEVLPIHGTQPLWLLSSPKPLREVAGRPQWEGPLELLQGPERVESGWWDEGESGALGDVRRDYFMASNPQGKTAWIFRDHEGWFLHGLFS